MFHSIKQIESFFKERSTLGIKPGLDRMYALLASQKNPEKNFKSIHIAGTNGKGSTLTYLKSALVENNYRVGVFTSPSFTGLTGYIMINNQPISDKSFIQLFNKLLPSIKELDLKGMHATEFEIITTIAYMYFSENIDIAIIEAGMGGREDSTNCIQPIVSIITNIAKDHASFLGETIEEIAYHKAGIIKDNIPVVLGKINPACISVIEEEVRLKNTTTFLLNRDYFYKRTIIDDNRQFLEWNYRYLNYQVEIQMTGLHQADNAATALMALQIIKNSGISIEWEKALAGLRDSKVQGRFEKIHDNPIIILDGAHNPNGMEAFLNTVNQLYQDQHKHLIFAGFKDKELQKMLEMALPYFNSVMVTYFDHPRAESAENLVEMVASDKVKSTNWEEEMKKIKEGNDIYFFAGSLHFIGIVREYIKNQTL
ncbi:bifunctional folylpolyglutamate synthase/dihydrofolate synthase [Ornithinibacillus sp. 179-J 7C1 HS]|uniref:bifunctional folylpolyglutamate synthase/dihydrofolate synthase n=1 Tax=Ornithinibacillus sp. 179-J 7C1 HS TaxID=3142384 RepID=UPI0039A257A5